MAIKSLLFTGESPPHMLANPIAALKELNDWRSTNPAVRLISIETLQRISRDDGTDDPFTETVFDGLAVWYEE